MIIKSCYIENFGKLSHFERSFSSDFNVIVSENGWGKTTFSLFLRAMLFGMESKRSKNSIREKYRPWQGGKYGGYIVFETGGKTYRAERYFFETESKDTFTLYDCETGLISHDYSYELGKELLHTDRETFEKTSYVPHGNVEVNFESDGKIIAALESGYNIGDRDYDKAYDALSKAGSYYEKRTGGKISQTEKEIFEINEKLSVVKKLESRKSELYDELKKFQSEAENLKNAICDENKKQGAAIFNDEIRHFRRKIAENISKMKRIPTEDELLKLSTLSDSLTAARAALSEFDKSAESQVSTDEKISPENKKKAEAFLNGAKAFEKPKKAWGLALLLPAAFFFVLAFLKNSFLIAALGGTFLIAACLFSMMTKNIKTKKLNREAEKLFFEISGKHGDIKSLQALCNSQGDDKADVSACYLKSKEADAFKKLSEYASLFTDCEPEKAYGTLSAMAREISSDKENIARAEKKLAEFGIDGDFSADNVDLLKDRERIVSDKIIACERELYSINEKTDTLLELSEKREAKKAELSRLKREFYIISETASSLTEAKTALKGRYADGIKNLFSDYAKLIGAPYGAELDSELNVNVLSEGETHPFSYYSRGERDLFGIALRFAVLGAIYDMERPTVILDDPLINLDEEKKKKALLFLEKLSSKYQMLYFTCDKTRTPDFLRNKLS